MHKTNIIGFHGNKGVGKNFISDFVKQTLLLRRGWMPGHLPPYEEEGFADPFKRFLNECLGLNNDFLYGSDALKNTITDYSWDKMPDFVRSKNSGKSGYMTIRDILQVFGCELSRDIWGDAIWIDTIKRKIDKTDKHFFLITDVRFQNEIDAIKSWGGIVIRIESNRQSAVNKTTHDKHRSESSVANTVGHDMLILNNVDVSRETLLQQVEALLKERYQI